MVKVQFVSPYHDEVDVVALGLTFTRDQIRDVSEEDAELLLLTSMFVRVDGVAPATGTSTAPTVIATPAATPVSDPKPTTVTPPKPALDPQNVSTDTLDASSSPVS